MNRQQNLKPFPSAAPGASTIETLLPLTLAFGQEQKLNLQQTIALLTHKPAEILGLNTGTIEKSAAADLCIFDPRTSWIVNEETLVSRGKNSPFLGEKMTGKVRYTLKDGAIVYKSKEGKTNT